MCLLPFDYHLSYEEAQIRVGVERPSIHLSRERLRWTGHILRSEDRVLSEVLTFVPDGGKRGRGRPRLRFYDTIKAVHICTVIVLEKFKISVCQGVSGGLKHHFEPFLPVF